MWIGSGVKIKTGLTIGDGAVIGAGAVVTKNIAPYSVVGGVKFAPYLILLLIQQNQAKNGKKAGKLLKI